MLLYRAMCNTEAERTINLGRPAFVRRFKWFSHSLTFIQQRVQGGNFNNSKVLPERYSRVLMFETQDIHKSDFVSDNEVQFDRKRNAKIVFIKELF